MDKMLAIASIAIIAFGSFIASFKWRGEDEVIADLENIRTRLLSLSEALSAKAERYKGEIILRQEQSDKAKAKSARMSIYTLMLCLIGLFTSKYAGSIAQSIYFQVGMMVFMLGVLVCMFWQTAIELRSAVLQAIRKFFVILYFGVGVVVELAQGLAREIQHLFEEIRELGDKKKPLERVLWFLGLLLLGLNILKLFA